MDPLGASDGAADVEPVELRRRFAPAAWWALLGLALSAVGVFLVVDTAGHPVAWAAAVMFGLVGLFFVLQLVAPRAVLVRLDRDALRSRVLLRQLEVPWEQVHVARVRRIAGDPVLTLEVREPRPSGPLASYRMVSVLLPVGCDLDVLHEFLAQRLGRGRRLTPPTTLRPLDL